MQHQSKIKLLGLPLVHIATGASEHGFHKRSVAKGWIAIGDISYGVILSVGGIAVGGIAIGGLSVGLLSLAGLALGVLSLGGFALGLYSLGGCAIAWEAASGGLALAGEYALGGLALAAHANDSVAKDYFHNSLFLSFFQEALRHSHWLLVLLLIPIVQQINNNRESRKTD